MPKPSYTKVFVEKPKAKHKQVKPKSYRSNYISIYQPKTTSILTENNSIKVPTESSQVASKMNLQTFEEEKIHEVLITDFKFSPQQLVITTNSIVSWRVDKNETVHNSRVYNHQERSFVVLINDSEVVIESDLLSKGQQFSYKFERPGIYKIQCANYREIQGRIEVYDSLENRAVQRQEELQEEFGKASPSRKSKASPESPSPNKSSLLLIKDFETDGVKELILELSLKSASDKCVRDRNLGLEDEVVEDFGNLQENNKRYEKVSEDIRNQGEVNIYESLISQEFNGMKLRSRNHSQQSEKQSKSTQGSHIEKRVKRMGEAKKLVEDSYEMFDIMNLNLPSLKNPKDEEQKFFSVLNQSQELEEVEINGNEEKEDLFLAFIKEEIKPSVKAMQKKLAKNRPKSRRRSNFKVSNKEVDQISAMKAFLANRFEFEDAFNNK